MASALENSNTVVNKIGHYLFNVHSITILVIALLVSWLLGKLFAGLLHQLSLLAGRRADKSTNLSTVNHLRRTETVLIMMMAIVKGIFIILGLYVWWSLTHPHQQPTAIIGASALVLVIAYGFSGPLFRDLAFGGGMMAEQWFGVGDVVTIQPNAAQGVVERVTLRSTKIKTLNGETVWISNQNINMVAVSSKGVEPIALELFVSDKRRVEELIEQTNNLLPVSASLVISPLAIMRSEKNAEGVWHITALAETAPGRDYLLTTNAVNILKNLDGNAKNKIILAEPIARFADNATEREFARAINNARKKKPNRKLQKTVHRKKPVGR